MTYEEVLYAPSDRQKILDYIDEVEKEHPYKVYGDRDSYSEYNEGWCDALDRVRSFIDNMVIANYIKVERSLDTKLHSDLTWTHQQLSDFKRVDYELNDAFETIGIMVRAKINRLCNAGKYDEALMLEGALSVIFSQDYKVP